MFSNELTYSDLCTFLLGLSSESNSSSLSVGCEVAASLHELYLCGLDDSVPSVLRFPSSRLWSFFRMVEEAFSRCGHFVGRCDLLYGLFQLLHGAVDVFEPAAVKAEGLGSNATSVCAVGLSALLDEYPGIGSAALPAVALDRVLVVAQAPYSVLSSRAGRLLVEHLRFYADSQRCDGGWCLNAADDVAVALRRLEVLRLYGQLSGDWVYEDIRLRGEAFYGFVRQDVRSSDVLRQARALVSEVFSQAEASAVV